FSWGQPEQLNHYLELSGCKVGLGPCDVEAYHKNPQKIVAGTSNAALMADVRADFLKSNNQSNDWFMGPAVYFSEKFDSSAYGPALLVARIISHPSYKFPRCSRSYKRCKDDIVNSRVNVVEYSAQW